MRTGTGGGPAPAPDVVQLLKAVFACGRLPAAEFSWRCPSVSQILSDGWVATDLPDGAEGMTEAFWRQTCARQAGDSFYALQERIAQVLCVEPRELSLPAPAPAARPPPRAQPQPSAPPPPRPFPYHPPLTGYPGAMARGPSPPTGPVA